MDAFLRSIDESQPDDLVEQAAWGLSNVIGDGAAARDLVLGAPGAVHKLHSLAPERVATAAVQTAVERALSAIGGKAESVTVDAARKRLYGPEDKIMSGEAGGDR